MKSKAADVDGYIEEAPEARREALTRLRGLCLDALEGYEEGMGYGMPCYKRPGGEPEVAFASQASYISLYIMRKDVLDRHRGELRTASLGKGCVRYSKPEHIDFDLVRRMLAASAEADGRIC